MRKAILLTVSVLTVTTILGQNYEPLDLAKKIFAKDSFSSIKNFSAGEYDGRPNGQDLQEGSKTTFLLLGQTDKTAVVAMAVLDSLGNGLDTYLHFKKDSIWKMTAFRALAMTGIIERIMDGLESMTMEQVDEIIKKSKSKNTDSTYTPFTSRDEYEFKLGNSRLILDLDDDIIKHFLTHREEFERLKEAAVGQIRNDVVHEESSVKLIESLKSDYQKLFISSVSTGGYELGKCINFLIGGMLDNTVGYIYVTDKENLPEMNPDRIIMIREIGRGWYLYKTT